MNQTKRHKRAKRKAKYARHTRALRHVIARNEFERNRERTLAEKLAKKAKEYDQYI